MSKLIIAEKPSVALSIAKVIGANSRGDGFVEGNGYIVSWCVGHLIELASPDTYDERFKKWNREDLPIIPDVFQYQVTNYTKKQYGILKKLMERKEIDTVVNACDAGREGELIFRLVYVQARCRKPIKRLWISSMEDSAIRDGMANLREGEAYERLYEAALCREHADWLIGMNATRLFSCTYGPTLNVGRVMTPTLAMIVTRDAEIKAFKPVPFYTVNLLVKDQKFVSKRFNSMDEAVDLMERCQAERKLVVQTVEVSDKKEKAPLLFDLTTLQREANKKLGYTSQQTLDYTQSLYEKKLVTYPRTDSRYLTHDMEDSVLALAGLIYDSKNYTGEIYININSCINDKKVTDHHAIIPTMNILSCNRQELPEGEQNVLKLIEARFLCAFAKACINRETSIIATCAGEEFSYKNTEEIDSGWKTIERELLGIKKKTSDGGIVLEEGQICDVNQFEMKEGKTEPPKYFTEDSLLAAMEKAGAEDIPDEAERKGIGTPATRAGTIEKLVRIGYVQRKGDKKTKHLVPTEKGISLITVTPEELQSVAMTADWEQKLLEIEKGEYQANQFMAEIEDMIAELVNTYEKVDGIQFDSNKKVKGKGKKSYGKGSRA